MATKQPAVSAKQLQQALYRKIADLERQDRDALARQIVLEQGGVRPVERPEPQPHIERAKELLNGSGHLLSSGTDLPGTELWEIIHLRKAIAVALGVLQKEETRIGSLGLAEWMANGGMDRWLAHRRRLADLLLAVTAEMSEGATIRREATNAAGGTGVSLPSDRGDRPILSPHATTVLEAIRNEVMK